MNKLCKCGHELTFHLTYDDLVKKTQYHYSICDKRNSGGCHKNLLEYNAYDYEECSCEKVYR
jgi:hypothetical protein